MLLSGCCLSERLLDYILQRVILCVADRLAPLVAAALAGNLNGDMAEPAVGLRTVPVLDIRRNGDDIADAQTLRGLALLLIPALAVNTDEQLSAAVRARGGKMIFEGRIGYPLADESGYGHDGAQLELITRTFLDILSSVCIGNLVSVDSGAVPML